MDPENPDASLRPDCDGDDADCGAASFRQVGISDGDSAARFVDDYPRPPSRSSNTLGRVSSAAWSLVGPWETSYKSGQLKGRKGLTAGGYSGMGRAGDVYARQGAGVPIDYCQRRSRMRAT